MEPHADQKMEIADQVLISLGGTFLVQDEYIPAVFHGSFHLGGKLGVRRELEREEKDLGLVLVLQSICRLGKFLDEPFFSLPVPEGEPHQGPGTIHPQLIQKKGPFFLPAFRQGEHRIAGDPDFFRGEPHGFQVVQGAVIPDGDQIHFLADQPGQPTAEASPNGPDALGKEHDFLPQENPQGDDGQVIVETEPAGHVLEQAASSGKEQVRPSHSPADSPKIEPMDGLYRVEPCGHFRMAGEYRQFHLGVLLFQAGHDGGEHGFGSCIGKAIIPGNQDLTQGDSSSFDRKPGHGDKPGRKWPGR